jgi:molecular chaperone GrpE
MNDKTKKTSQTFEQTKSDANDELNDVTNFQDDSENKSENASHDDNLSDDMNQELSWEEKYTALNDSHLRLIAEFDNFRKRTLREKADLIKSGGATALTNLLPVIDDFERAMNTIQTTEDMESAVKGVTLIYEKFIQYLSQQGVKLIETVDQPFTTDLFEAVATFPVPQLDRKGLVIDCVQTGYMLNDKVLRHAKVVVGE